MNDQTILFREKIPKHLKSLISSNNNDPGLVKQFKVSEQESHKDKDSYFDISNDREIQIERIYHRYPTKVLLFLSETCLGHCRFCFRKNILEDDLITDDDFNKAINYIKENKEINEVILSGGDPFSVKTSKLIKYIEEIRKIDSVKFIRLHTRVLTFAPNLLSEEFLKEIKKFKPIYFVFHINHPLEICKEAKQAVSRVVNNGIPCFSQTALLNGVNNNLQTLTKLFEDLLAIDIKPYYLFHSDKVEGAEHFYLPIDDGRNLYRKIYNRISGLGMPIYLFNIPDGHGHCIMDLDNIRKQDDGSYLINTWEGKEITYNE